MKTLKRVLLLSLFLGLLLVIIACASDDENKKNATSDGLVFELNEDGKSYYVKSYEGNANNIIIPDIHNKLPVTAIGEYAFENSEVIERVYISDNVTELRKGAFAYCEKLLSVNLPKKLEGIGSGAFIECAKISIPIVIPDSVTFVGESAFERCCNIPSITIGKGVKELGDDAFDGCYKLVELVNNSSLTNEDIEESSDDVIDFYVFEVRKGKSKIDVIDDFLFYTHEGVNYLVGYVGEDVIISLPNNYKGKEYEIYKYAFHLRDEIISITVPKGVTKIGKYAFDDCHKLKEIVNNSSVEISQSGVSVYSGESKVENINGYIFYTFEKINYLMDYVGKDSNLTLPENYKGKEYCLYERVFENCGNILSVVISDGVTEIEDLAFAGCLALEKITFGNNLKSIGRGAFARTAITEIIIPNSITAIEDSSFYGCARLTNIIIPNKIVSIGSNAFSNCVNLSIVNIPDSVTRIEDGAFKNCTGLASVTVGKGVENIGDNVFANCTILSNINIDLENDNYHVSDNCLIETNSKTLILGLDNGIIPSNGSVIKIADYAFENRNVLSNIVIPESVIEIGSYAFSNCSGLTSVTIGIGVKRIGANAFYKCNNLTAAVFKNPVGWYWNKSVSGMISYTQTISIPAEGVADASTAATYLTDTYTSAWEHN